MKLLILFFFSSIPRKTISDHKQITFVSRRAVIFHYNSFLIDFVIITQQVESKCKHPSAQHILFILQIFPLFSQVDAQYRAFPIPLKWFTQAMRFYQSDWLIATKPQICSASPHNGEPIYSTTQKNPYFWLGFPTLVGFSEFSYHHFHLLSWRINSAAYIAVV